MEFIKEHIVGIVIVTLLVWFFMFREERFEPVEYTYANNFSEEPEDYFHYQKEHLFAVPKNVKIVSNQPLPHNLHVDYSTEVAENQDILNEGAPLEKDNESIYEEEPIHRVPAQLQVKTDYRLHYALILLVLLVGYFYYTH